MYYRGDTDFWGLNCKNRGSTGGYAHIEKEKGQAHAWPNNISLSNTPMSPQGWRVYIGKNFQEKD